MLPKRILNLRALNLLALNLLALNPLALSLLAQAPEPKVLLVFIDGFLPDAIAATETPALDRLLAHAAISLRARAESTTISGSGWSSFVNGVHWDKHGVPDNAFETPRFDNYPHVLQRLKEARPDAFTASAQSWKPIEDGLVIPAGPDRQSFHDYYAYSDDYWDAASCDAKCTDDMVRFLGDELLAAAVIMYGELDGVAHSDGNKNYHAGSALYRKMLRRIDGHLGRLLDAIEARPTSAGEDWLIIVSADHAGAAGEGHGKNTPEHREIPFIVSGRAAHPGEIWPPPKTPDVAATALTHLGVELDPAWQLDGRAVGLAPSERPVARLGKNLIFNGDAEYERAQLGNADRLDVSIPGWDDPGWMTVVAYPEGKRKPVGNRLAAGYGRKDATIRQTIDASPLTQVIDTSATFDLSARLGGKEREPDAASVHVQFLDASGGVLAQAKLGPQRGGAVQHSTSGAVPKGTRSLVVELIAHAGKRSNDGWADNLSLVIKAP